MSSSSTPDASPNFAYLGHHDVRLVAPGTQAEEHFAADPSVTLFKLRQFGEVLAKRAAAKVGMFVDDHERQIDLIHRLHDRGVISIQQRTLLHDLRKVGNTAVHEGYAEHAEALHQLKMARELGVWFQRAFGNDRKFDPGPFVPPPKPKRDSVPPAQRDALERELAELRKLAEERGTKAAAAAEEAERARKDLEAQILARMSAEERAAKAEEERQIWEALAADVAEAPADPTPAQRAHLEQLQEQNEKLAAELAAVQAAAAAAPSAEVDRVIEQAAAASDAIKLTEAETRRIIDKQLRAAGWEADSDRLRFERGVRPQKGKNIAIAEWPTEENGDAGYADYVLFHGLRPLGVVEAKRKRKDVFAAIVMSCGRQK